MHRKISSILITVLFFLPATAGAAPATTTGSTGGSQPFQLSPPGTLQKIPAPPVSKPMEPQPPPAPGSVPTPLQRGGALNPKTGEFYPSHGEGVINPRTGEFYPPSGSGYINSRTGEYYPSSEPGGSK